METIQISVHPMGRERVSNEKPPNRPRAPIDARDGSSPRNLDASHSGNLPKGFEGMLKTTTETGDIGMFSIKPSRLPHSFTTPRRSIGAHSDSGMQRTRQVFQPYGIPNIDDRRRLPSYARDPGSDGMSLYGSASQKSTNRALEEPDSRSYSMTQTSNSSYTLSNHKSYASLRGHQDTTGGAFVGAGGILQRPRSPFAYPTRLKRPGFRPSSPALTDGGIVDYSRRAEIDRLTYNSGHNTSSPSSLYALRRKPPLTLRLEGNKSTPSLLSQSSPHRRSSSPQAFLSSGNDWPRRNGVESVNTSPARSTFSLASTVNLRTSATATSVTTTPGRIPPSSPLYYDYTEDFEFDEYRPPEVLPPPSFTIHKTIPEDRPMSSHSSATEIDYKNGLRISLSPPMLSSRSSGPLIDPEGQKYAENDVDQKPDPVNDSGHQIASTEDTNSTQDQNLFRHSGLDYGARELSSHVEEAFGLIDSPPFDTSMQHSTTRITSTNSRSHGRATAQPNSDIAVASNEFSQTSASIFPHPSSHLVDQKISARDSMRGVQLQGRADMLLGQSRDSVRHSPHHRSNSQEMIIKKDLQARSSLTSQRSRVLPGGFSSHTVLVDLVRLDMLSANKSNLPQSLQMATPIPERAPASPPKISIEPLSQDSVSTLSLSPPLSSGNEERTAEIHSISQADGSMLNEDYYHEPPAMFSEYRTIYVPNFSHQISKSMAPQESPILAPKPISPARQLKLKNSIPQLMKALPPLPPELGLRPYPQAANQRFIERELPRCFSPAILVIMPEMIHETGENSAMTLPTLSSSSKASLIRPGISTSNAYLPNSGSKYVVSMSEEAEESPPPPPKLKLKLKAPTSLQPQSLTEIHPWNLEENYPWVVQDTNTALLQTQHESNQKRPRFKLKVTRSSLKGQGTVRINRSPGDSRTAVGLNLETPKDFFTPASGIESIFRQVSKRMHSRRTSNTSSLQLENDPMAVPDLMPLRSHTVGAPLLEPAEVHLEPPSNPLASFEARSCFSDDSSQEDRQSSLRRRLTNLKSKIPVPYVSRAGTQSSDDITWKDRNGGETATAAAARSIPNLHGDRASTDTKPMRRFAERLHRQRLKAKMQRWLNGARAVIGARVKARSAASITETTERASTA